MNSSRTVAAIVLVLAMASSVAQAQARIPFAEYSAKFLCGVMKEEDAAPVPPVGTTPQSILTIRSMFPAQSSSRSSFWRRVKEKSLFRRRDSAVTC